MISVRLKHFAIAGVIGLFSAGSVTAERVGFDGSWKEQGFLRLFSNDYVQRGPQLDVISDGTVSLLWRPLGPSQRLARTARWAWRVQEGVPATDLTVKGGDDRNLAVYFVFVDPERADAFSGRNVRRILREESARALIYVWGGAHAQGANLPSPYSPRLRTVVLRGAGAGSHRETVDLAADYLAAFGGEPGALIGLAVSADSDDTDSKIVASVSDLAVR